MGVGRGICSIIGDFRGFVKVTALLEVWNGTEARERAEFMATVCKRYASLICEILKAQTKCPASTMKKWLFDDTGVSKKIEYNRIQS